MLEHSLQSHIQTHSQERSSYQRRKHYFAMWKCSLLRPGCARAQAALLDLDAESKNDHADVKTTDDGDNVGMDESDNGGGEADADAGSDRQKAAEEAAKDFTGAKSEP